MGTMAQGMAFGTGSSIAHGVVGSLMGRGGGSNQQQQQEQQQAPTSYDSPASAMMFEGKPINEVSAQEVDWMDVPYQCQADKQSLYDCLSQVNENVKCQRLFASLKACKDNNY